MAPGPTPGEWSQPSAARLREIAAEQAAKARELTYAQRLVAAQVGAEATKELRQPASEALAIAREALALARANASILADLAAALRSRA